MKYYKELLLKKLTQSGWELSERVDDTDWWLDECWRIISTRASWGDEIFILFLVDPQYEGLNKHKAVWAVMATTELPDARPSDDGAIILVDLQKGKYEQKLDEFVSGIDRFRSQL